MGYYIPTAYGGGREPIVTYIFDTPPENHGQEGRDDIIMGCQGHLQTPLLLHCRAGQGQNSMTFLAREMLVA